MGRPLIAINAERYAHEAELRFALVRISECAEAISVHGGEMDERRALDRPVDRVVQVTRRLANGLARLTWITSGYGWLALLVPILVASPGYFHGTLSFGELMMTIGAFNQVEQALRWFVDSFPQIADWRATLLRVVALHDALPKLEALGHETSRIRFVQRPSAAVAFEDLSVILLDGCIGLDRPWVELAPGDHLLITGEPGADKSVLFRAMAGVWPWGSGTVHLPPRAAVMFVPQRSYLPSGVSGTRNVSRRFGTLRRRCGMPALDRVGLGHLIPALDREKRWDKELSPEQQQRLVLARVLLHRPRAVFFDEVMGALRRRARPADPLDLRARTRRHDRGQHRRRPRPPQLLQPHRASRPPLGWRRHKPSRAAPPGGGPNSRPGRSRLRRSPSTDAGGLMSASGYTRPW